MGQMRSVPACPAHRCRAVDALSAIVLFVLAACAGPAARAQPTAGGEPVVCRIGVNVEDLYDLDMARDTFGAILWIWSVCPSPEWRPLETMAFPTASSGPSLSPVETIDLGSGGQYASLRAQGIFRYKWNVDHYA